MLSLGDSLWHARGSGAYISGQRFSAFDIDQDSGSSLHCAQHHGAWWHNACSDATLNGIYVTGGHASRWKGIMWYAWKGMYYSLKRTEMKIRPN